MAKVTLDNVCKRYGPVEVVHNVNLDLPDQELVVLVGPSGCGKSTTLRMIAGLEEISAGTIHIGERLVNDVAPKDRDIAMVFQSYALYPHMSVRKNLEFGLKMRRTPLPEINKRVDEAAGILGIEELLDRKPRDLSGGQRQRVAMGRAIVRRPSVFLFDEPLSNLDAKLRGQMRIEIARLHANLKTTTVYVTHDQVEAMTLADRIVVMESGVVQQVGAPLDIYNHPANRFVAGFIGMPSMNFARGKLEAQGDEVTVNSGGVQLDLPGGIAQRLNGDTSREVIFGVRPPDLLLSDDGPLEAQVEVREPMGAEVFLHVRSAWGNLVVRAEGKSRVLEGDTIRLSVPPDAIHLFDGETERSLLV